jgi:Cu/Ag efflux protein CusF
MQKHVLAAAVAALMMSPSLALAWSDVTGTINSIDQKSHQVTLDNGQTYTVETGVSLASFKPGDKVTISTESKNGANTANKVTKASSY